MSALSVTTRSFHAGVVFAICIESLVQDALGREGYIAVVRAHWISGWITVPIALVGLTLALAAHWHAGKSATGGRA